MVKIKTRKGSALVIATAFSFIALILVGAILLAVNALIGMAIRESDSTKALFLAEAGIERALAQIRDTGAMPGGNNIINFSLGNANTGLSNDATLDAINITVTFIGQVANMFDVRSSATVGDETRTIRTNILYNPPAPTFDYGYFLNNWGWFFGAGITVNGNVRSNGRVDFQGNPTIEGEVWAGQDIGGQDDVSGMAGTFEGGEYIYQHPNSPSVEMPNLQDLTYYSSLAVENDSSVIINGVTVIDNVYGDDGGESGNMVLIGTADNPVEVSGPVVITGDVVIRGVVTGQGTIYAGRNVYVAGEIEYDNAPTTPRPASSSPEDIHTWVTANETRDVVGLAASENIIMGNYEDGSLWPWLTSNYLFNMGSEDVGADGIPDTGDAGEDDGEFQPATEDLDGDGVFDDDYTWTDIQTGADITTFTNVPLGTTTFGDISTNNITSLEGVFYTNHALSGWGSSLVINGGIVSKDEAIAAFNSITINYDERINSVYKIDPNWLIDLQLPLIDRASVVAWWEE